MERSHCERSSKVGALAVRLFARSQCSQRWRDDAAAVLARDGRQQGVEEWEWVVPSNSASPVQAANTGEHWGGCTPDQVIPAPPVPTECGVPSVPVLYPAKRVPGLGWLDLSRTWDVESGDLPG